ncbi:MAG TPA: hypothetical protein VFS26_06665 [Solirubrobacterales bacterium]|nr:hypothetical protein [Solirubrobacterales bacterium]
MSSREVVVEFLGKDRSLGSTIGGVDSRSSRLGSTLAKVGKVAALGLAAGAVVAGKALYDMGKAAAADEQAQQVLRGALERNAGATDKQVAAVESWITAQGKALGVTDDELRPALGRLVTATKDVGEAQKLASLAMDVSAATGKSLESVSTALMKAQNGQVSSLTRLGINTKNAAGETISMEQAVKRMSDQFGGAAAEKANTFQGKMDRLRLIFDETKESIGAKLLPIVEQLGTWFLDKGLPALSKFGDYLGEKLPMVFERIRTVVRQVLAGVDGDTGEYLDRIREIVVGFVELVRVIWDKWGQNLINIARRNLNYILGVVRGALQIIAGVIKVVTSLIKGDWRGVWQGMKEILRGVWTSISAIVKFALGNLRALMKTAWDALKVLAAAAWSGLVALIKAQVGRMLDTIANIPGRIRQLAGLWGAAGRFLIGAFVDGMKNAAGIVSGIAGNVWSAVKGLLNDAIGRLRSALNFTIPIPGPDIHVNVGNSIPYLAKGGIVRARPGGRLIVAGEGGRDEAVVPLPQGFRGGLGGTLTIVNLDVRGVLTEGQAGREIERVLIRMVRDRGVPLQVRTVS